MKNYKSVKIWLSMILLIAMIISTSSLASCVIILPGGSSSSSTNGGGSDHEKVPDTIDDNYRTLYQIYVRSFADSDGDGVGDIRGIIETFDYLNDGDISSGDDLGVQAIWLTPIFHGNSAHKYDAIDFYAIDPEFGTLDVWCRYRNNRCRFMTRDAREPILGRGSISLPI